MPFRRVLVLAALVAALAPVSCSGASSGTRSLSDMKGPCEFFTREELTTYELGEPSVMNFTGGTSGCYFAAKVSAEDRLQAVSVIFRKTPVDAVVAASLAAAPLADKPKDPPFARVSGQSFYRREFFKHPTAHCTTLMSAVGGSSVEVDIQIAHTLSNSAPPACPVAPKLTAFVESKAG